MINGVIARRAALVALAAALAGGAFVLRFDQGADSVAAHPHARSAPPPSVAAAAAEAVTAQPARAQPTDARASSDEAALEHWNGALIASAEQHLFSRLAEADPRDRAISALALIMLLNVQGDRDAATRTQLLDVMRAASDAAPDDALLARLWHDGCAGSTGCDADSALRRWQALDGDDASSWLAGIQHAQNAGDERAVRALIERAARTGGYDRLGLESSRLLVDALLGAPRPPLDAGVAARAAATMGFHRGADAGDLAISWASQFGFLWLPPLLPVSRACPRPNVAPWPPGCEQVHILMASHPTLIFRHLALPRLIMHHGATEPGRAWREQLRTLAWLQAMASETDPLYLRELWQLGEVPALHALLRRRGVAPRPPAGWLPADARTRSLILTGAPPSEPRR